MKNHNGVHAGVTIGDNHMRQYDDNVEGRSHESMLQKQQKQVSVQ